METHANSTPVQVYATCMCLPKGKAKEQGHCQKKILPRLWTTIWQRRAVWKTLFQNKSSGTINPVYLPRNSWTTQRMYQSKQHCLSQLLPNMFILQLERIIPWTIMNDYDPDRVLFWKKCNGKKCIRLLYFGLGVECYLKASSWALSIEPIHAMTYECYTRYKFSTYSETNSCRYADRCSPFGVRVRAPIPVWALSMFLAEGHGVFQIKSIAARFWKHSSPTPNTTAWSSGFQCSIYLSIYLSIYVSICIYLCTRTCFGTVLDR